MVVNSAGRNLEGPADALLDGREPLPPVNDIRLQDACCSAQPLEPDTSGVYADKRVLEARLFYCDAHSALDVKP